MNITQSGKHRLLRFRVEPPAQGRIGLAELGQDRAEFGCVGLRFRIQGDRVHRLRIDRTTQRKRCFPAAQRIAGVGMGQLGHRANVTGVQCCDRNLLLAAQQQQLADPFILPGTGVEIRATAFQMAAENAEIAQRAHIAIRGRFEHESSQRLGIALRWQQVCDVFARRVGQCCPTGRRRRHIDRQRFQQWHRPDIGIPGSDEHRHRFQIGIACRQPHPVAHFLEGQFLRLEILVDQRVACFGGGFDQGDVRGSDLIGHFRWGVLTLIIGASAIIGFPGQHINHAFECRPLANGQHRRHELVTGKALPQRIKRPFKARVFAVDLVDDNDDWLVELVGRFPGQFRPDFRPGDSIHRDQYTIRNPDRVPDFALKIGITGRIEQVYLAAVKFERQQAGADGQVPGALVLVIVGNGAAVGHMTDPRDGARAEQQCFGQAGFTGTLMTG